MVAIQAARQQHRPDVPAGVDAIERHRIVWEYMGGEHRRKPKFQADWAKPDLPGPTIASTKARPFSEVAR